MRISVIGQDGVAATLRGHLAAAGYELTDSRPAFRLTVEPVTGE